ncbi:MULTISPECIES: hypothetical protein [unclassified Streptomyces]|uniref:hypothetical protein n=1 Tax=unclassified Streptomyces TaxID=2593676 RepID=UPI001908D6A0|nr:hypothetical protein [Streptomyces sp. HSG2]
MAIDLDHAIVRSTTTLVAHDRPTLREDDLGMAKPTGSVVTLAPVIFIGGVLCATMALCAAATVAHATVGDPE